jgi:hypothetical protein
MAEGHAGAHETRDTPPRVPIYAMIATVATLFVGVAVVSTIMATVWQRAPPEPSPFAGEDQAPPTAPRLQPAPWEDMELLRSAMERRLNSVGWLDREADVVHMPIERAMNLIAQRGLPSAQSSGGAASGSRSGSSSAHEPARALSSASGDGGGQGGNRGPAPPEAGFR